MAFDLKNLDTLGAAERGMTIELKHPFNGEALFSEVEVDGKKKKSYWTVSVVGVGSRLYNQAQKKLEQARKDSWANKHKQLDEEKEEELIRNISVACTTGWAGITEDGKLVEFSRENAVRIYRDYPWLANQVNEAMYNIQEMLEKN